MIVRSMHQAGYPFATDRVPPSAWMARIEHHTWGSLPKPSKPSSSGTSYRPAVKVLERLILPHLTAVISLQDTQHCFRPLRSTTYERRWSKTHYSSKTERRGRTDRTDRNAGWRIERETKQNLHLPNKKKAYLQVTLRRHGCSEHGFLNW